MNLHRCHTLENIDGMKTVLFCEEMNGLVLGYFLEGVTSHEFAQMSHPCENRWHENPIILRRSEWFGIALFLEGVTCHEFAQMSHPRENRWHENHTILRRNEWFGIGLLARKVCFLGET